MKKSKNERRKKSFEKKIRNFFKILGKNAHFFRNVTVQRFFERSIYDNDIVKLEVNGFDKYLRVMLKFEEISNEEVNELPNVDSVGQKVRPTGKYVVEWGAILA